MNAALDTRIEREAERRERAKHEPDLGSRLTPLDSTQPRAGHPDASGQSLLAEFQLPPARADEGAQGSWCANLHDELWCKRSFTL